jgi:hypothetical protein
VRGGLKPWLRTWKPLGGWFFLCARRAKAVAQDASVVRGGLKPWLRTWKPLGGWFFLCARQAKAVAQDVSVVRGGLKPWLRTWKPLGGWFFLCARRAEAVAQDVSVVRGGLKPWLRTWKPLGGWFFLCARRAEAVAQDVEAPGGLSCARGGLNLSLSTGEPRRGLHDLSKGFSPPRSLPDRTHGFAWIETNGHESVAFHHRRCRLKKATIRCRASRADGSW